MYAGNHLKKSIPQYLKQSTHWRANSSEDTDLSTLPLKGGLPSRGVPIPFLSIFDFDMCVINPTS